MADLTLLDVGHGNSAVLQDAHGTVIIDAGLGSTLLELLIQRGTTQIDAVIISHADSDHLHGLLSLLLQPIFTVRSIYLNADSPRGGATWRNFRMALADARKRDATRVHVELTTESSAAFDRGDVQIEVVAPVPELAASGVGGTDLQGRSLSANALSAVLRVNFCGTPQVLLAGDLDEVGLDNLLEGKTDIEAPFLVFPHHGGRPGSGDPFQFARRIGEAVHPQVVVFSTGRGQHGTPLPQIVLGIRSAVPSCHIACTELSTRCATALPIPQPAHLGNRPAKGRARHSCCAGTLELRLSDTGVVVSPILDDHRAFVDKHAPTALCRERGISK